VEEAAEWLAGGPGFARCRGSLAGVLCGMVEGVGTRGRGVAGGMMGTVQPGEGGDCKGVGGV